MADDKEQKEVEQKKQEGKKKKKTKSPKKSGTKKSAKKVSGQKSSKTKSKDNGVVNLIIVIVIVLGIVGIVFGYTKSQISDINKGGTEVSKGLENQIKDLKNQISTLKQTADKLEKENKTSKNIVLDLFNKDRQLPRQLDVEGWNMLKEKGIGYTVSYPQHWEKVKPILGSGQENDQDAQIAYLQPIGKADFINAVKIKKDYYDFEELPLDEKLEIFSELDALDTYEFEEGIMIYFINLDKDNNQVPTVLVLTDKAIYRIIFNAAGRDSMEYFKYRQEFEKIAATFALMPEMVKQESKTDEEEETNQSQGTEEPAVLE
ncbi:MAG TPA: hypothetical protein VKP03_00705 [Patescibacteria group bacterium]|nr:hypothetical protein [Patescibacteria group bacterium]